MTVNFLRLLFASNFLIIVDYILGVKYFLLILLTFFVAKTNHRVDFYIEGYYIVRKTKSTLVNEMINESDIKKIFERKSSPRTISLIQLKSRLLRSKTAQLPGGDKFKYEFPIIYDFKGIDRHRKEGLPRKPMDGRPSMEGHPWRRIDGDK